MKELLKKYKRIINTVICIIVMGAVIGFYGESLYQDLMSSTGQHYGKLYFDAASCQLVDSDFSIRYEDDTVYYNMNNKIAKFPVISTLQPTEYVTFYYHNEAKTIFSEYNKQIDRSIFVKNRSYIEFILNN